MRKLPEFVLVAMEVVVLAAQLTALLSMHWTTWNIQFNWTQSPSGQLVSQGNAGLWSRCVQIFGTGRNLNSSKSNKCLPNSEEPQQDTYSYGKTCKRATAFLCVGEAFVTFFIAILMAVHSWWKGAPNSLNYLKFPLLFLQGVLATTIPVLYISGNMAELIDHLAFTYGELKVTSMNVSYAHDWAYWLQGSIPFLWMIIIMLHIS